MRAGKSAVLRRSHVRPAGISRSGDWQKLMQAVESKAIEMGAEKLFLRAAINAPGFYQKLGYDFVDGQKKTDEWGNILLEKRL